MGHASSRVLPAGINLSITLARWVSRVASAPSDDVGGRPLDDALKQKVESADGLIALVTPQAVPEPARTRG